jgi:hypothetical protein
VSETSVLVRLCRSPGSGAGRARAPKITGIALLAVLCVFGGCAGRPSAESVSAALVGSWVNVAEEPQRSRSAAGAVVRTIGVHEPPWAASLVFREDGRFEASYPDAQAGEFRRRVGDLALANPVEGRWHVERDWVGVLWIHMSPGPGTRRLSLEKGVLVLHHVGEYWGAERFRRP